MFGMLVHSCYVDDGSGTGKFNLLDTNGCALDPVILGDLTYNSELNQAYVESHAFKFADKVTTYFQCAVSLCMKSDGACVGLAPPTCNRNRARFARDATIVIRDVPVGEHRPMLNATALESMDVAAEKIYVLDIDDDERPAPEEEYEHSLIDNYHYPSLSSQYSDSPGRRGVRPQVCLSPHGFGLLLASFVVVSLIALSISIVLCFRSRNAVGSLKP